MCNTCDDNRFKLIEKYKTQLIESTNIEDSPEEMAVLDTIFFRFWQMDWLDKLEEPSAPRWIPCFERLPEENGDYLVTDDSGGVAWVEKSWFMRAYDGETLWECNNPIAWMPLPEPYRKEATVQTAVLR